MHTDLGQFQEQTFGAIEQPGLEVILPQLQQGLGTLLFVQCGTGDQILVHPYRTLDLAAPAEQVAQGEMGFDRARILRHLDKHLDGLVRLFVQLEIEPLEVGRRQIAGGIVPMACLVEARDPPAGGGGHGQQQPQQVTRR